MSIIHMDTERVRTIARALHAMDDAFARSLMSVNLHHNMMPWEGGSKDEFIQQRKVVDGKINSLISELVMLAIQLSAEVDQWEEVSSTFEGKVTSSISAISGNPTPEEDFSGGEYIGVVLTYFGTSAEAEAFRQAAVAAGITFVFIDEAGKRYTFGAVDGEVVEVKWEDNSAMPGALGSYDSDTMEICINDRMQGGDIEDLQGTLAHEMQHAIDYKTGRANNEIKYKPYNEIENTNFRKMSKKEINDYDWDSLETDLEASCNERVKTEIAAHSRGYEMDDGQNWGEDKVNSDTNYTAEEYEFILEERGYERVYQDNTEAALKEKGVSADVDVYWNDELQQIEVNISNVSKKGWL